LVDFFPGFLLPLDEPRFSEPHLTVHDVEDEDAWFFIIIENTARWLYDLTIA